MSRIFSLPGVFHQHFLQDYGVCNSTVFASSTKLKHCVIAKTNHIQCFALVGLYAGL